MVLQVGAHCSLSSCNALDFLPITCSCSKSFCKAHILPDKHQCSLLESQSSNDIIPTANPRARCYIDDCSKFALLGNENKTCSKCYHAFCVDHRFPDAHNCPSAMSESNDHRSGFSTRPIPSFQLPIKKPPTDPKKLIQWQKMEIMKMRHRASPGDPKDRTSSLPPNERLHVRILKDGKEHVFWFRKTVVTGRALDLLVTQLKLSFPGNQILSLEKIQPTAEGIFVLLNDQLLVDQVEDGTTLTISPKG